MTAAYVGRFAPSPTGALHAGSLVAALASWLDARAHPGGRWLVRIEDVDRPRCQPGAGERILAQLAACGLQSDGPVVWQAQRGALYQQALEQLVARGLAYPCACTRKDIAQAHAAAGRTRARHVELPYPGTCRQGLGTRPVRAWRFATTDYMQNWPPAPDEQAQAAPFFIANGLLHWQDRRLGAQQQDVAGTVGDFVLLRADGCYAYQLAVVVDDAAQQVTHVVRGEDLADNTPRQMLLQSALGLPTPRYLHMPLVCGADGEKLSKQHGAAPLQLDHPVQALDDAAAVLGLPRLVQVHNTALGDALALWVKAWDGLYNQPL